MPRSTTAVLDRASSATPASPPAQRQRREWWRDTRVILGIVLVVGSVLLGARIMTLGDDSVDVWRVTRDLAPGATPSLSDVVAVAVPADLASAYARVDLDPSRPLAEPVRAGEFLPKSGVTEVRDVRWVTLPVEPLHAPADLAAGDLVEVWSTPDPELGATAEPVQVHAAALVVEVGLDAAGFGGEYGVVVEVDPADTATLLDAVRGGAIDLVRVPVGGVS